jgi:hypothetical protein
MLRVELCRNQRTRLLVLLHGFGCPSVFESGRQSEIEEDDAQNMKGVILEVVRRMLSEAPGEPPGQTGGGGAQRVRGV